MRFRRLLPILCLASTFAVPARTLAQPPGPGGPGPLPMPLMIVIRQLNLTSDQQDKVHQIMGASFTATQPLMKQLRSVHDQIADLLMSTGTVSASDLAPLQQQESQIHQKLDQQMLSAALQIRALLTPDQLLKASELHKSLKALRTQMDALVGDSEPPMGPPGF